MTIVRRFLSGLCGFSGRFGAGVGRRVVWGEASPELVRIGNPLTSVWCGEAFLYSKKYLNRITEYNRVGSSALEAAIVFLDATWWNVNILRFFLSNKALKCAIVRLFCCKWWAEKAKLIARCRISVTVVWKTVEIVRFNRFLPVLITKKCYPQFKSDFLFVQVLDTDKCPTVSAVWSGR